MRARHIVTTMATAFAISACSSADPAAIDNLATQLSASSNPAGAGLSEKAAECRARIYLESDLSKEARTALAETGMPTAKTKADREELREVSAKIQKECS